MFLDTVSRSKGIQLLKLGWTPPAIAIELHCHPATVYRWERRLQMHGYLNSPLAGRAGGPQRLHQAAKASLAEYVNRYPWVYQEEMALFLFEEWDIRVSQSTISRLLKEMRMSRKVGQRIGPQSHELRVGWQADMLHILPSNWYLSIRAYSRCKPAGGVWPTRRLANQLAGAIILLGGIPGQFYRLILLTCQGTRLGKRNLILYG